MTSFIEIQNFYREKKKFQKFAKIYSDRHMIDKTHNYENCNNQLTNRI